jgi:DNA/RNA endonuclease YhcR with UshA esterase domain
VERLDLILLVFLLGVFLLEALRPQPRPVREDELIFHTGDFVRVESTLKSVRTGTTTYLEFGNFSAIVIGQNSKGRPDISLLEGKRVEVEGLVELEDGRPTVIVEGISPAD